jgi:acyl-CoA synthetase (AMP-forming)/AMP-acid ligase II
MSWMIDNDAYLRIRQCSLGDVLREHRRSRPHMLAAIDGDLRLTYAQLDERVNRLADALRKRGIGRNDRIAWIGQNSVKLMEILLAAAKLGALLWPANWRLTGAELQQLVDDFDPKLVFWQDAELGDIHRREARYRDDPGLKIQHDGVGEDSFDRLLEEGADVDLDVPIASDEPLLTLYTSGFDGRARGAMISHAALTMQSLVSAHGQAISESSRYLVSGPMYHMGVLMASLAAFFFGGTCVYVPRVEAANLLSLIERERVTHAYLPTPVLLQMRELNAAKPHDLSSLFSAIALSEWTGTLVMPPHAPMAKETGGYGQTEVSGFAVHAALGGTGAGRPYPFMQVRIIDEHGEDVPPGEVGEIAVRGPMVMCGYWNRPEENMARTAGGWYRTHDLGRRLDDGSICFVSPKTTLIKSGIENIYPAEVEACIRSHPAVADVCVIGVPDPKWDQNVKALVVLKQDTISTAEEIIAHCRASIASYKKPKIVTFVDALPRTQSGTIDRIACDAAHGGGGYPSYG